MWQEKCRIILCSNPLTRKNERLYTSILIFKNRLKQHKIFKTMYRRSNNNSSIIKEQVDIKEEIWYIIKTSCTN